VLTLVRRTSTPRHDRARPGGRSGPNGFALRASVGNARI
jgi:hypothetical protein